jgi:hypothetical protein
MHAGDAKHANLRALGLPAHATRAHMDLVMEEEGKEEDEEEEWDEQKQVQQEQQQKGNCGIGSLGRARGLRRDIGLSRG